MIFVTVGTQLPFDRLVMAMDHWAATHPNEKVFAQIGPGAKVPSSMQYSEFVPPDKANALMRDAELIVAHAGMGSVLTALKYQRPILILPRKADLGEHRNDHQLATARWLCERPGINVAWEIDEIQPKLDSRSSWSLGGSIPEYAQNRLLEKLATFINKVK